MSRAAPANDDQPDVVLRLRVVALDARDHDAATIEALALEAAEVIEMLRGLVGVGWKFGREEPEPGD